MNAELKIGDNVYNIKAPTIEQWIKFNRVDSFETEDSNLYTCVKLMSVMTGEKEESILECPYPDILGVGNQVLNFIMSLSKKFHKSFIHNGVEYCFVDLNKISFGHWMDIEHFINKKPSERKNELNIHLALLYLPKIDNGKYLSDSVMERAELFKNISIEYYFGAIFFLQVLKKELRRNSPSYLHKVMMVKFPKISWMITRVSMNIGLGLLRLRVWQERILQRLKLF